jgi:transposase
MTPEDAEEFTRSLGQIIGGSWRQIALAKRLGVPKALGLDTEQWVRERLGGYIKLSVAERRQIVADATADGHTQTEIAEFLGVDKATISRDVANATTLDAVATLAADEKVVRAVKAEERRQEQQQTRDAQHVEDGCTVDDLQTLIARDKKFGVIYADPPWVFKVYSGKGKARSADRHYKQDDKTGESTLSIEDLKALPIPELAATDSALLLWAVMPELPGALEVMKAWGFTYNHGVCLGEDDGKRRRNPPQRRWSSLGDGILDPRQRRGLSVWNSRQT